MGFAVKNLLLTGVDDSSMTVCSAVKFATTSDGVKVVVCVLMSLRRLLKVLRQNEI